MVVKRIIFVTDFVDDIFFSVGLLSVLRGHSVFSSPPQRPMTSDFEGFSIPDFIHYIYFLILILEKFSTLPHFPHCHIFDIATFPTLSYFPHCHIFHIATLSHFPHCHISHIATFPTLPHFPHCHIFVWQYTQGQWHIQ